ncbi:hypothetical protein IKQ21_04810 [bacterium]|nr:hypothetical protein [bacterium]
MVRIGETRIPTSQMRTTQTSSAGSTGGGDSVATTKSSAAGSFSSAGSTSARKPSNAQSLINDKKNADAKWTENVRKLEVLSEEFLKAAAERDRYTRGTAEYTEAQKKVSNIRAQMRELQALDAQYRTDMDKAEQALINSGASHVNPENGQYNDSEWYW